MLGVVGMQSLLVRVKRGKDCERRTRQKFSLRAASAAPVNAAYMRPRGARRLVRLRRTLHPWEAARVFLGDATGACPLAMLSGGVPRLRGASVRGAVLPRPTCVLTFPPILNQDAGRRSPFMTARAYPSTLSRLRSLSVNSGCRFS